MAQPVFSVPTLATPQEALHPLALAPMVFRSQALGHRSRVHSVVPTHTPCLVQRRVLLVPSTAHLLQDLALVYVMRDTDSQELDRPSLVRSAQLRLHLAPQATPMHRVWASVTLLKPPERTGTLLINIATRRAMGGWQQLQVKRRRTTSLI